MTDNITTYQFCIYLKPVSWDKSTEQLIPLNGGTSALESWNFSEKTCISTTTNQMIVKITDNNSTSSFYLTKDFSYGDIFTIFFLTIFSLFLIFNFIMKFVFKSKVSFRH